jgi:hypothetical protein
VTEPDKTNGDQLRLPSWRWEALKTTFWLAPTLLILVAGVLFVITIQLDLAAFHHHLTLPTWVRTGSADAGREVLIGIAAAIITTIGVVFSITILALTLASQQFGPRMLRNFIRDLGNQMTLAVFVGTFVYSVLVLGSITAFPGGDFVPHLSITSRSPSNFQKSSPASRGTSTGPSTPSFPIAPTAVPLTTCPHRPLTCSRSWTLEAGRSPPDTAVTSSS